MRNRSSRLARIPYSRPLGLLFLGLMLDCATLSPIPEGTCGNGVVDANEDCDSFPDSCGKPGSASACRLTCDRTKGPPCAAGWGCSVDGICRQATGSFDLASEPTSAGVVSLLAGDFDGDGRADLYGGGPKTGTSKPRIHFFDSTGTPATPVSLPFPMSLPFVRDVDGDGRDDLAYAYNADERFGALALLAGTADRAFSPVLVPSYVQPTTNAVLTSIPYDPVGGFVTPSGQGALLALASTPGGNVLKSVSGTTVRDVTELSLGVTFGPDQLAAPPVVAALFKPTLKSNYCGELIFAYNDGATPHVATVSPCGPPTPAQLKWSSDGAQEASFSKLKVPGKIVAGSRVIVAPVNDVPVVFVQTETGFYFAKSDGTTLDTFEPIAPELLPFPVATSPVMPFAVTDFDGDGRLDSVLPTGIGVSGPVGVELDAGGPSLTLGDGGVVSARPANTVWQDARLGDLNGDGRRDVVAFSPDALELEVFINEGARAFTRVSIPSTVQVRALTLGDFDGDGLQDVAFLASSGALGAGDTDADAQLVIAYGRSSGGPEAPRVIGKFKYASSLTALHQVDRTIDTLVVSESIPVTGKVPTTQLTYVYGSGDRQAIAPLVFDDGNSSDYEKPGATKDDANRKWQAAALVAAPLAKPGVVDLASIAYGLTYTRGGVVVQGSIPTRGWLAAGAGDGTLGNLSEALKVDDSQGGRGVQVVNGIVVPWILTAAADIDNPPDGISEIVALLRDSTNAKVSKLYVVTKANRDTKTFPAPLSPTLEDVQVSGSKDDLQLLDVDADGLPDAVILTRSADPTKSAYVRVYLNDAKGGFDLANPLDAALPPRAGDAGAAPADPPLGFARVITGATASGKPQSELAIVTRSGLYLAKVNAARKGLDVRDVTDRLGEPLSNGLTSIAAGDFDGDGVQDLAVADSGSIRLLRQIPRLR